MRQVFTELDQDPLGAAAPAATHFVAFSYALLMVPESRPQALGQDGDGIITFNELKEGLSESQEDLWVCRIAARVWGLGLGL